MQVISSDFAAIKPNILKLKTFHIGFGSGRSFKAFCDRNSETAKEVFKASIQLRKTPS